MDQNNLNIDRAIEVVDLAAIESIAHTIWHEHYTPIIGKEQVDYMLNKYQSLAAMLVQLQENYRYYGAKLDSDLVGYLAVQQREDTLFISKLYVLSSYRGRGLGKQMLHFIRSLAREMGCKKLGLTVNRHNQYTIQFYKNNGFFVARDAVSDIGNGFVMDDHVMEANLS